jgi:predicted acylesterase/phospholipase RssA
MVGTSAGAWTAAALAVGADLSEITHVWNDTPREGKPVVIDLARSLFGYARAERVSAMAIRLPMVYPRVLAGADHDLADLVAASSSPPRLAAPHRINGRRHVDAGILSTTSAHRVPPADLLVVVAPMVGPVLGRFGAISARMLAMELAQWRMTGGRVLLIRPDRVVGALAGTRMSDVVEASRAEPTYRAAYELGARRIERFRTRHPRLALGCAA